MCIKFCVFVCVFVVGSRESLRFLDTIHPVSVSNVFFSNSSSPRNMASLSNRGNQAIEGKREKKGEGGRKREERGK